MVNKGDIWVKHLFDQCRYLMGAIAKIDSDTGFGTVEFEVKDSRVAYRRYTVREHPKD